MNSECTKCTRRAAVLGGWVQNRPHELKGKLWMQAFRQVEKIALINWGVYLEYSSFMSPACQICAHSLLIYFPLSRCRGKWHFSMWQLSQVWLKLIELFQVSSCLFPAYHMFFHCGHRTSCLCTLISILLYGSSDLQTLRMSSIWVIHCAGGGLKVVVLSQRTCLRCILDFMSPLTCMISRWWGENSFHFLPYRYSGYPLNDIRV